MEQFSIKPTVCFGEDALAALDHLAGKRVLIVTDGFLASSGLLGRVTARLVGCTLEVFDQVTPDPSLELVAQGVKRMEEVRPDGVVAFGGGSPMDCAKAMVYFSSAHPPLYAIPTTAGTGSEVTSFAVLTHTGRGIKYPLVDDSLLPSYALLDPGFLTGVPPGVTADTGMDVLTHAAEAYVATGANPFTDALAEGAFVRAYRNLPAAFQGDGRARGEMLYASCLAGLAFNAAGLGICHALAHTLGGSCHLPHGRLNALLLPRVIAFNSGAPEAAQKYAQLAKLCGLAGTHRALIGGLNRLLTTLGLTPSRLEIADPAALARAALDDRCAPSNPRAAGPEELEAILREVGR
jgi:1-propanol dehydrogenase